MLLNFIVMHTNNENQFPSPEVLLNYYDEYQDLYCFEEKIILLEAIREAMIKRK